MIYSVRMFAIGTGKRGNTGGCPSGCARRVDHVGFRVRMRIERAEQNRDHALPFPRGEDVHGG